MIDTYVEAKESRQISAFGELGLLDLILKLGIAEAIDTLPAGIKTDKRAVAETIANNVRSKILKSHLLDPAFYDRMSALLAEIEMCIRDRATATPGPWLYLQGDNIWAVDVGLPTLRPNSFRSRHDLSVPRQLIGLCQISPNNLSHRQPPRRLTTPH